MKKLRVLLLALCMLLSLSPAAFAVGGLIGPSQSAIDRMNQMREELAKQQEQTKSMSALMAQVTEKQAQAGEAAKYLNQARDLQKQAETSGKPTQMPADMMRYLDENRLNYDRAAAGGYSAQQWRKVTGSLEDQFDKLGLETQQLMVKVQNAMGEYNASSSMPSSSRGQSLFSTEGMGNTDLPPIATSLIVGVILGMAAMWAIERSRQRRSRI